MKCWASYTVFSLYLKIVLCDEFNIVRIRKKASGFLDVAQQVSLICVTDTINDAIIFNADISTNKITNDTSSIQDLWQPSRLFRDGEFFDNERQCDDHLRSNQCKFLFTANDGDFIQTWNTDVPMGPVFDSRWERFEEHNTFEWTALDYQPVTINQNGIKSNLIFYSSGTLVVSIRGRANAHFLMCTSPDYRQSFCYWIIIGGWRNTLSVIRKCEKGVSIRKIECEKPRSKLKHSPLSSHEWKTFVIMWDGSTKTIKLYDPDMEFLNYTDGDSILGNVTSYSVFFGNPEKEFPTRFRFHQYDYTLTNKPEIQYNSISYKMDTTSNGKICIDMMVGLCAACELHVRLVYPDDDRELAKLIISGLLTSQNVQHGLPMWQHARIIDTNIEDARKLAMLKITTKSTGDLGQNHWAIGDVQQCPPKSTVKQRYIQSIQVKNKNESFVWPDVTCQRLSYNQQRAQVISSNMDLSSPPENVTHCQEHYTGLKCSVPCYSVTDGYCKGVAICDMNQCYCSQGYYRNDCWTGCAEKKGEFGYNCREVCDNCSGRECSIYTGRCKKGCRKLKGKYQYVPPFCKDTLKLPELHLDQISETALRVYFPEVDHDKKFNITYVLELQINDTLYQSKNAERGYENENRPIYFTTFDKLSYGMKCRARVSQSVQYKHLDKLEVPYLIGDFSRQTTICKWTHTFTITSDETSLTVKKTDVENFPCPDDWYLAKVLPASSVDESQHINIANVQGKFPLIIRDLTPDTKYVILITGMSSLFSLRFEMRTLPTKSYPVEKLKIDSVTSTDVSFSWLPPKIPDGNIHGYSVTIKALRHEGCVNYTSVNFINSQSYNITNTTKFYTIHELIPYVNYELTILAHHTHKEEKRLINFITSATKIPSAVYKNISYENGKIKWTTRVADCSTITGPLHATRLFFFGVSENVKNFTDRYDSIWHSFTLGDTKKQDIHGCEQYRVRIHALRNINGTHNATAYNELIFTTDPHSPDPPGKVFTTKRRQGIVDIEWEHPPKSGGPIKDFIIQCELISTRLREKLKSTDRNKRVIFPVINYQMIYNTQLKLLPSTHYKINIVAIVVCAEQKLIGNSTSVEIETPVSFDWYEDTPSYIVHNVNNSITLTIPRIAYETQNSEIHVVMIGKRKCEKLPILNKSLARDIELKEDETAWHVNSFSTSPPPISIGDYEDNSNGTNCSLADGSYVIVIVVREDDIEESKRCKPLVWRSRSIYIGPVSSHRYEYWAVPLLLFLIIGLIGIVFYLKRSKNSPLNTTSKMTVGEPVGELGPLHPTTIECQRFSQLRSAVTHHELYLTPINEHVYEEIRCTTLVKLHEFQDYVKVAIASGELGEQYSRLSGGQVQSWEDGLLSEHASGEEYDIGIARDETVVILEENPDDPYFECTNAHYINGYKKDKAYIVLQGPQPTAVINFWRIVWQERVEVICMLSDIVDDEKIKCNQYWPAVDKSTIFGNISVDNISHSPFADYTFRTFLVKCGEETRVINHLHYTAWPDYGIPLYTQSIVRYLKKLLALPSGVGPIIFHCSAGVGRTGTLILFDICHRRAVVEGVLDVFGVTEEIKRQRANMVNTKQQYIFAHVVLVECLLLLPTAITCDESLAKVIKKHKNQLRLQQKRLEQSVLQDEALQLSARSRLKLSEKNIAKNRFKDSLPTTRLYIPRYPTSDDDSSYISGVYVDSARRRNSYIASQLPLPTTVTDFWRMIAALKVELIIILQQPDIEDPTCCKFVPGFDEEIETLSFFNIKGKSVTDGEDFFQQKIVLIDKSTECSHEQQITILTCKGWDPGRNEPPPALSTLVDLWQSAERISRRDEPTVVLCHDGATGCGLYLALSFLLERMGLERECDVCFAVRAVRRSRSNFCQTLDQLRYLYNAALLYAQNFDGYANFK